MADTDNPNDVPTVTLGGREFPIPELAVRQLRKVRRPMIDLSNLIVNSHGVGNVLLDLSDEEYDRLVIDTVYWALTRGTKDLTKEEFLDLSASESELMTAWVVARKQAGAFIAKSAEEPDSGEAAAPQT